MKFCISVGIMLMSFAALSQDTVVITPREKVPLQAMMDVETGMALFAGQPYTFTIVSSGDYDLRLTVKNAQIELIEQSKKTTGGLRYTVIPIDTGMCSITVGNQISEKRTVALKMQYFSVVDFPMPPLNIGKVKSGEVLSNLKNDAEIKCYYPKETGVDDLFEIADWTITIGEESFAGNGSNLSEDLIEYINTSKGEFLHLTANLDENKTGYTSSEAIFIIR